VTRTERTIRLMRQEHVTPMESASHGGVYALSQLVSRLEADGGYVFSRRWVELNPGRVMSYKILKAPKRRKECK
jgi:hypothetical protein